MKTWINRKIFHTKLYLLNTTANHLNKPKLREFHYNNFQISQISLNTSFYNIKSNNFSNKNYDKHLSTNELLELEKTKVEALTLLKLNPRKKPKLSEIKHSYRKLVSRYHPDIIANTNPELIKEYSIMFNNITE